MLEISTSGLMSGDGKTERALQSAASPRLLNSTKTKGDPTSGGVRLANSSLKLSA